LTLACWGMGAGVPSPLPRTLAVATHDPPYEEQVLIGVGVGTSIVVIVAWAWS